MQDALRNLGDAGQFFFQFRIVFADEIQVGIEFVGGAAIFCRKEPERLFATAECSQKTAEDFFGTAPSKAVEQRGGHKRTLVLIRIQKPRRGVRAVPVRPQADPLALDVIAQLDPLRCVAGDLDGPVFLPLSVAHFIDLEVEANRLVRAVAQEKGTPGKSCEQEWLGWHVCRDGFIHPHSAATDRGT